MQRIIQINIAGRVLPVEENAYTQLSQYITALENQYAREAGGEDILADVEGRIAELFELRLQSGAYSINKLDVAKVIETLGMPSDFEGNTSRSYMNALPVLRPKDKNAYDEVHGYRKLFRSKSNKMIGGVCSGLGVYFDIDPLFIRLVWAALAVFGVGIVAYLVAWILIPQARSQYDMQQMGDGSAMNFQGLASNVTSEMKDLQVRAQGMTRDLRDFFTRK